MNLETPVLLARVEAFLAVARLGNLTRAADELCVTQPALTARLKGLEADMDATLFVRTSRGMRLTEAGREFLPYAMRAVATLGEGRERLAHLRRDGGGNLTLGAPPGVSTYTLPPMLQRFSVAYPHVAITVRTGHTEDVLAMVLREETQLGLGREIRGPDIEVVRLYEDELALVVPTGHALAGLESAPLAKVARERLILFDKASSYYELTRALFLASGVQAPRAMELDNIEAAKQMVEHGLGVALLPRSAVARDVAEGRLWLVRIEDGPALRRPIVAFRRRDAPRLAAVDAFLRIAREIIDARDELPAL